MLEEILNKYKIMNLDCKYLYEIASQQDENNRRINIRDDNGAISMEHFTGYIDRSIETEQLERVYSGHKGEFKEKFNFKLDKYDATLALINVQFSGKAPLFTSQYVGGVRRFIRFGYSLAELDIKDHICIEEIDGKDTIIAIETPCYDKKTGALIMDNYGEVENAVSSDILGKFFEYSDTYKCYVRKMNDGKVVKFPTKGNCHDMRVKLYEDGFVCDGIHYIRYKRSAGRSRKGGCLFIPEILYDDMIEWSASGLDEEAIDDLASWEAYIALTLSNQKNKVTIPLSSILFMRDVKSVFNDRAIVVEKNAEGQVIAHPDDNAEISNNIWDGESLLDRSIFEESGYGDCGMMQLRNKFFKTCAFNTNIQQWLEDNNITKISQLNGFTLARKVSDIKMIVTESSLKYIKLFGVAKDDKEGFKNAIKAWKSHVQRQFGVIKTDSPTKFMDGKMVQTSYQIINTIGLTKDEAENLLVPSIEYIEAIKSSPLYLRHYINCRLDEDDEEDNEDYHVSDEDLLSWRSTVIKRMIELSDEFSGTYFYHDFQNSVVKAIKDKLRRGKILIKGTYCTLFGNGAELLKAAITKGYQPSESVIEGSNIYTTMFEDGKRLLCYRNPHITMGNILIANNQTSAFYDKYFNLTPEIVCVNAINNNIQYRLNGCDYDSDTMLITDNEILLGAASRNYDRFLVPICPAESESKHYNRDARGKADLDEVISDNVIGKIINLSQLLNSILWDMVSKGAEQCQIDEVYNEICKLAVLSGLEIDKAKRLYNINTDKEFKRIMQWKNAKFGTSEPKFFQYIKNDKVVDNKVSVCTAMEYVFDIARKENACRDKITLPPKEGKATDVSMLELIKGAEITKGSNDYKYRENIETLVEGVRKELVAINMKMLHKSDDERLALTERKAEVLSGFIDNASRLIKNTHIVELVLRRLDDRKQDERISLMRSLLFGAICLDKKHLFYDMITLCRRSDMYELEEVDKATCDTVSIYGFPHKRVIVKSAHIR